MLKKLSVKNFALIENAEIIFTEGFNVISGETGSGKSILLESLNFVLGAKADKNLIRNGQDFTYVCAEFDVSNLDNVYSVYNELDFEIDDTLIITRKFTLDGKNSIKINGNSANVSMIKKFTQYLVDVHGQSEHFSLLSASNQMAVVDKYGGDEIHNIKTVIKNLVSEYKNIDNQLSSLGGDENTRLIRLDVLNFQINEIKTVDLKDGEFEELNAIRDKLKNQEKITNTLLSLKDSLLGDSGALDIVSNACRSSKNITSYSSEYDALSDKIYNIYSEIEDASQLIEQYIDSFDYSDYDLDEVENRLSDIKRIKKKYGETFNEISKFLSDAIVEKDKLENFNDIYKNLLLEKDKLKKNLYLEYDNLRACREKISDQIRCNVLEELSELGLKNSNFDIKFSPKPCIEDCDFTKCGYDEIEFLFTANLGEPLKPLSSVISGGEMSRFLLALKTQTSRCNEISCFVFDEIDAGISGLVARIVGEKLVKISKNTQVIAITHLPQIVAFGDNNLLIYKQVENECTYTKIKTMSIDDKINEISRLIGGSKDSKSALDHSLNVINEANNFKKNC